MRLTIKEADKILQNYDFGTVTDIKRLTGGYANLNYKIRTFKGNFLLRICKEKPLKEIKHEIKVMYELKKINFPTAFPIQRKDNKYINITKFGEIVLYEFVSGVEPKITKETIKEIARAVAKLNSLRNWKN